MKEFVGIPHIRKDAMEVGLFPFVRCIMGSYSQGQSRWWGVDGDGEDYVCPQGPRHRHLLSIRDKSPRSKEILAVL